VRAAAQERRGGAERTGRWAALKGFFRDAWQELQRVIWPTREDVVKMTGLVIAVVVVVGMFIFLWDRVLVVLTRPLFE
jgi:preprotein translocase subunit SecE